MMKSLRIGSAAECDIVYNESGISGSHAFIKRISDESMLITDDRSTNGTYVNGQRIKEQEISISDQLLLGTFEIDLKQLFGEVNKITLKSRTELIEEFKEIYQEYHSYKEQKKSLELAATSNNYINRLSGLLTMIPLFLLRGKIDDLYIILMISAIVIFTMILTFYARKKQMRRKEQTNKELVLLEHQYGKTVQCPKCETPLLNNRMIIVEAEKCCPNCKVILLN